MPWENNRDREGLSSEPKKEGFGLRGGGETACSVLLRASSALKPWAELQGVNALGGIRAAAAGSCNTSCAGVEEAAPHSL